MRKTTLALLLALLIMLLSGVSASAFTAPTSTRTPTRSATTTVTTSCTTATPATASGFNAMFGHTGGWNGGDAAIATYLGYGRTLWLMGDSFTSAGFVHSDALIQRNGCLREANSAAPQVFPNDTATSIYWIDSARYVNSRTVLARAAQVDIVPGSVWGFKVTGLFRSGYVTLTSDYTVKFGGWVSSDRNGWTKPYLTKTIMQCAVYHNGLRITVEPSASQLCPTTPAHEFSYNPQVYRWAHLASGRTLIAVMFNNSSWPMTSSWFDYRPHFFEVVL